MAGFPKITHFAPEKTSLSDWKRPGNTDWKLQEKIDGSNFWFHLEDGGELVFGNKSKIIKGSKIWRKSIDGITLLKDKLNPRYIYFGESLPERRSVTIAYERTPPYWVILFDIKEKDTKKNLAQEDVAKEAERIGLMSAEIIYDNTGKDGDVVEVITDIIAKIEAGEISSCLGGPVEGVVVKHPNFTSKDGKVSYRRQKFVTEKFKEQHHKKNSKLPHTATIPEKLVEYGETYATEARFVKSVQRFREEGKLNANPNKNIQPLMDHLDEDLLDEKTDDIQAFIVDTFEDELTSAYKEKKTCFHNICINPENQDGEKERINKMLFIEFSGIVLKASKKGFNEWYKAYQQ